MNPVLGWALAAAAVAVGWMQWRWPGVVLAITVIVFWLLLQFSRALRVLRVAGQAPLGHVASAVMLNTRLQRGMRLPQILALTKSLGRKLGEAPETFEWTDTGGDCVRIELRGGRLDNWTLARAPESPTPPTP